MIKSINISISLTGIIIILSVMALVAGYGLFFMPAASYGASVPEISGFMDLQSSIKALQLKVVEVRRSVVMIIAYDDTGAESGRGSGVFIDSEGRILTNAIILENAYSAEVFSGPNNYEEVVILNRRDDLDLALIQVKAKNETPLELEFETEIGPGERVVIIGKSSRLESTVSEGLISTIDPSGFIEIQTTKQISSYKPSKSGLVINWDGKLLGITTTVITNTPDDDPIPRTYYYEKFNAISLRSIKSLVESQYEDEVLHLPGEKVWSHWLLWKLDKYTFAIFIVIYNLGFMKIVAIVFAFILLISLVQWLYSNLMRIKSGK